MSSEVLVVEEVAFGFEIPGPMLFENVSFRLRKGELIGIVGPNGSGKTTLLNICSQLSVPTSGEIYFDVASSGSLRSNSIPPGWIGRSFQRLSPVENLRLWQFAYPVEKRLLGRLDNPWGLLWSMTGGAAIGGMMPISRREREGRISLCISELEALGVPGRFATSRLDAMSVGVRRIADVLRALYLGENLFVLDEPFANVQPEGIGRLCLRIRTSIASGGAGVVTDHNLDYVRRIADRVLFLGRDGLEEVK